MSQLTFCVTMEIMNKKPVFMIQCEQNERFVSTPWSDAYPIRYTVEIDALNHIDRLMDKQDRGILHIDSLFVSMDEQNNE